MKSLDTISAWLHITDRCNLRCSYCFLPHNPISMPLDIAFGSIDSIFRSALIYHSKDIVIKYAGGEPLLEWDNLLKISTYAKKLSQKYSINLYEGILTNGTLIDIEKLDIIKKEKFTLTISYDGDSANTRNYSNGKSSNRDILEAIKLAIKYEVMPNISIVINSNNISQIPPLIEFIMRNNLLFKLNLARSNPYNKDTILKEDKIINGMDKIFQTIEDNLNQIPIDNIFDEMSLEAKHKVCGAGENYLVFNVDGSIAKCQMQINKQVTSYKDKNPIVKIQQDDKFVKSFDIDTIDECKECYIRYYCKGGCPLETFNHTSSYRAKSPHCNIYKAIFPKLLRLKGIQKVLSL